LRYLLLLCVLVLAGCGSVEAGAERFDAGKVDEAIEAWSVAPEGDAAATALYDLGCAWYRKGEPAKALAHWRAARLRRPWSGELAHNIALARSDLEDHVPDPVGAPVLWMDVATIGQMGIFGFLLLLAGSLLAIRWHRKGGSAAIAVSVWMSGLAVSGLAIHGVHTLKGHPVAVVVVVAQTRDAPSASAGDRFDLPVGSEVSWIKAHKGFVLIETGEGERGWAPASALMSVGPWVGR
jgi:hypothetical protein